MKKILGVPSLVIALVLSMVILPANAIAAFSDVSPSAWYANDVESVQQYGIINGTGNGKFSPNGTLTLRPSPWRPGPMPTLTAKPSPRRGILPGTRPI